MSLEKYVGRLVTIVYIDRNNRISQRTIQIHSVRNGVIRAYCMTSGGPRIFHVCNVLAAEAA
jgi:hypothetical protein